MPRIILAKAHPPTSIEDLPKGGERSEVLLLPGLPCKVTAEELEHIVENYPALTILQLQREKGKGKAKAKAKKKPEVSKVENAEENESVENKDGDRSDKETKKSKKRRL